MGKVWLITGSGSGLGRDIAEAALVAGDRVYESSVGPIYKMMSAGHGNSASDPRKIADIVVRLSNREDVPKRLILGKDAEIYVRQGETARAEEAAKYRDLTLSTEFSDEPGISRL